MRLKTYNDGRHLFLTDAEPNLPTDVAHIPVIDGWSWEISGTGTGCLHSPDGKQHCQFDLLNATIAFEPDGECIKAPGLSAAIVQDMGEKYAYDIVFSDIEKAAYDEHVIIRNNTKKVHDRGIYSQLKGLVQLEQRDDGSWLAHVDADKVKALTGIESNHVISSENGYTLFNRMCEKLSARPLRDPSGYMALKGNLYDFIHTEYQNQYEDVLQGIDNQMIDSTGYGVEHVLKTLQSTIRHDIREYLPKGKDFGTLRFVPATDERKQAVQDFVKYRVSKTLTYEKKRSYEQSSIDKTNAKFVEAGNRLKELLTPTEPSMAMAMS